MSTITNRNGFSGGYTATVWTLSGLVLAACGGGGSSSGPGRGAFPTGLTPIPTDGSAPVFPVSGGMITDLMLPRHVSRNIQPYDFADIQIPTAATIDMESTAFRADGSLPALAFGVPVENNVPMLDAGEWVRVVSMGMSNLPDNWDGLYKGEGPRGEIFTGNPFGGDKMRVKELYIKLVDGHTLTNQNLATMMDESDVHKIYFDADVFRNGDAYQGNIRGTILVTEQDGDVGVRGDVDLYLTAELDDSGDTTGDVTDQYTLSVTGFNVDTFRAIDNETLSGQNKNLLGYMVGGDLGNNYLRWIGQSRDGGAGPNGALAVAPDENGAGGDTIYADFYINIPDGWNVRLIWWLDDVLGDMSTYHQEAWHTRDNLPGFDSTLDFDYAGLLANPDTQTLTGMVHVSENPMIEGVEKDENGNYMADADGFISGFSDIEHMTNQFAPTIAGRYYVQVVAYDNNNGVTPQQQMDTAYFGFDNLHEIDVQTADFSQELFDAFYSNQPAA